MLKIGITGGIGSGKSTVSKIFEVLGIPVYYADIEAKRLMTHNVKLKQGIIDLLGIDAYIDGELNRKYIASIVFNDTEKLAHLNSLVHPATLQDIEEWTLHQKAPYIIKEAAVLFESGAHENLDKIIGVFAPAPLRIKRTMDRDNIRQKEVVARIHKQMDEEIKMRLCDYVISNNEQELVIPQVIKIHENLLEIAN